MAGCAGSGRSTAAAELRQSPERRIQELHEERLRPLPGRPQDKPNRELVAERFEAFRAA